MKKFNVLLSAMILMVSSGISFANPGSWTPAGQLISGIIVEGDDNGTALVIMEGGVPSSYIPSECVSQYNTIPLNTDKGRSMFSLVLAAQMSGKRIKLALACDGSRPTITHVWVM